MERALRRWMTVYHKTNLDLLESEAIEVMREVAGQFDGTLRKLLDVAQGWAGKIPLREALEQTYRWYLAHLISLPPSR